MIVCKKCGHRNSDGESFCASCGTFLEWNSERVSQSEPVTKPTPVPTPPPPPPEPTLLERVKQAVGLEEAPPARSDGQATAASAATTQPTHSSAAEPAASAAGIPIRAASDSNPSARLPQATASPLPRPRAAPRPQPRPSEGFHPGDLICGQCGVGNPPTRRFCRRCGAALVEAVVVETPWWRRILPARAAPRAGIRPGTVRRNLDGSGFPAAAKLLAKTLIALIVVGVVVGLAASPDGRKVVSDPVNTFREVERYFLVGEYVPVRPESARGSSEAIGHEAHFLVDPNALYWATDTASDPQPVITLKFAQPTDLDYVDLTSGAGADYAKIGRPRHLKVTYSSGGKGELLTLNDDSKPVRYHLHGRQVSSMQLQVVDVYPTTQSTLVAISELDLFRLK